MHDALVQNLKCKVVEFDERHGFAVGKDQAVWEATMPVSDPARKVRFGIKKVHFMVKKLERFRSLIVCLIRIV